MSTHSGQNPVAEMGIGVFAGGFLEQKLEQVLGRVVLPVEALRGEADGVHTTHEKWVK
jgi:hypothetical protein